MAIRDYTSIHNVKDFLLNQIAPRYFDIDDISLLNTGLFGMITDISGTVLEDNFNTTSRYITELIPGKSRLPEFIYAYAANYGITDIFATCAQCTALLFIKESDVLENASINGGVRTYVIDSDLTVYVEDVPFSIPYDIKIVSTYYNNTFNHRCYYDQSMVNGASPENLPYIKCGKTTVSGETEPYLVLSVRLFQYKRNRKYEQIITNSKLNIPSIDVTFSDKLCNFEVLYTATEGGITRQLTKVLERGLPMASPFTFYKSTGDDSIRLSFANDDSYFVPEYNSTLEILTYETLGSKGEMPKYEGEQIYVTCASENPDYDYNNSVSMFCVMISDSTGASDGLNMEQISQLTAEKRLTVNSITTDNDLDQYFGIYSPLYNTYAKFIKFRDDLVSREYSCYTRLRDTDNVFPTNTVDIVIDMDKLQYQADVNANRIIVKSGTRITYDGDSIDECIVLGDNDTVNDIEYTTIGLLSITKSPTSVGVYMNSVNKTIPTEYSYINDYAIHQFIMQKLTVLRDAAIGDNSYTIECTIIPTDMTIMSDAIDEDYEDIVDVDEEDQIIEDNGSADIILSNIHVYLFVETESGHYIEMTYEEDASSEESGYIFKCDIGTTDITNTVNIELENLFHCGTQTKQNCFTSMENPPIKFIITYDTGSDTSTNHEYAKLIPQSSTYTLCNIYKPVDGNMYFAYPMNLIKPTVEFLPNDDSENGYNLKLYDVPVVGRDFVTDLDNLQNVLDRLNSQHEFLSGVQITSNYSINMKFFNTFGRSRCFTVTTGALLNKVNCDMDIQIKFKDGVVETDYIDQIKLTIKEYIESCNDSSSTSNGVNDVRLSALVSLLHTTYPDQIRYIVVSSLNGYGPEVQTIIMGLDLTLADNMYTIPEFLTVNVDDIKVTVL